MEVSNINQTLLVLIPKVDSPKLLKNFCPINLCNMIYEIVMKILVTKVNICIPNLIAPNQCSFVLG